MEQDINISSIKREEHWQEQMTAWKASGLNQMQYYRGHQLSKHAFVYQKLKRLGKDASPVTLLPLGAHQPKRMHRGDGTAQIRLVAGQRYRVEVHSGFNERLV